jgi:hypothetical protein
LLNLDLSLNVGLLLEQVAVNGLVDSALECFVGFGCLYHDALEGRTMGMVA